MYNKDVFYIKFVKGGVLMKKGLLAKMIVGIFTFNLAFSGSVQPIQAKADTATPIISQPRATLMQMEDWARSKGATNTFISLAKIYWDEASTHGGIDPVLAYAQSGIETGLGKFSGLLDESYKNPCGMKVAGGGADDDKLAHQKFDTWEDGVSAHLDHLALYAGSNGYPKKASETKDPRHFPYLLGNAKNAEDLSKKWASSETYGEDIKRLMNEIVNTPNSLPTLYSIDTLKHNSYTMTIDGWALMQDGVKSIDVLLNGKNIGQAVLGLQRDDVKAAYPKYGTLNSGFKFTYRINQVKEGKNLITLEIKDNKNRTSTINKELNVTKLPYKFYKDNISISSGNLNVSGWALLQDGVKTIELYLDNNKLGNAEIGLPRPDVSSTYPGYTNGQNSGFKFEKNLNEFAPGNHAMTIKVIGNDGSVYSENYSINIEKLSPLLYIDSAKESGQNLQISGWALNSSGIKNINVYVDGKSLGQATTGISRPDVKAAYPSYKDGDKSGFNFQVSSNTLAGGKHDVIVEAIGVDGSKKTSTFSINIDKKLSLGNIDGVYVEKDKVCVSGWALSPSGVSSVEVYFNDKLLGTTTASLSRPDVNAAYPGYLQGKNSGFTYKHNLSEINFGVNKVKLVVKGNDGTTMQLSSTFNNVMAEDLYSIDAASLTWNGDLNLSGWILSQEIVKKVSVYVNGQFQGDATIGMARPDVSAAYPIYSNDKGGFSFTKTGIRVNSDEAKVDIVYETMQGTKIKITKTVKNGKMPNIINIDSPKNNSVYSGDVININGWALSHEGNKQVNVYVDGTLVKTNEFNEVRKDVNNAYPKYTNCTTAGFNFPIDISSLSTGRHDIKVEVVTNYGFTDYSIRTIHKGRVKTIMLDPGHNFKGTSGASGTVNGVIYDEKELNWAITDKLKTALEGKGYNVLLTTRPNEQICAIPNDDLRKIASMANDSQADLFVSIHHDSSSNSDTNGISTHYSSYRPNIDSSGIITGNDPNGWYSGVDLDTTPSKEAIVSKELADDIAQNLSNDMGYKNLKSHDHNLYVTKNTNMPSILIECGFVTSTIDGPRLANQLDQLQKVGVIAKSIDSILMRP